MRVVCILEFVSIIAYMGAQFHQNSYDIAHDHIDLLKYNRSFVRRADFKVLPVNGSRLKGLNASGFFVTSVEKNLKIKVSIYRFTSNSYTIFPFNVTLDGCEPNKKNIFGLNSIFLHTNFAGCPVPKGYLYLKYYVLEQDKFPPHLPLGKYKVSVYVTANDDAVIGNGDWYGALVPKLRGDA